MQQIEECLENIYDMNYETNFMDEAQSTDKS